MLVSGRLEVDVIGVAVPKADDEEDEDDDEEEEEEEVWGGKREVGVLVRERREGAVMSWAFFQVLE